ncbi:MAG: transcription elongation factor GreA [Firmicutes bacterium]|nr:transcription elongation factor GreA [Bacillota bacterium]
MNKKQVFLSKEGYKQLEERLEYLKVTRRPEVAQKIKIARSFGDLSENAEYDAAKEEQAMLEGDIADIEQKLRVAQIIKEDNIDTSKVSVGCRVKLKDMEFNETVEYRIVGVTEANPNAQTISNESPMGKALLGRKKNDIVIVEAPGGKLEFKILAITV